MSVCEYCNQEMLDNVSCVNRYYHLSDGSKIKAIPHYDYLGEECHDCACKVGQFHHLGCDNENCPNCGGQFVGCDCDFQDTMTVVSRSMPKNTILWKSPNGKWTIERLNGPYVRGNGIIVADDSGWNDNPIMYEDGSVAYEYPERIPAYVKKQVSTILKERIV